MEYQGWDKILMIIRIFSKKLGVNKIMRNTVLTHLVLKLHDFNIIVNKIFFSYFVCDDVMSLVSLVSFPEYLIKKCYCPVLELHCKNIMWKKSSFGTYLH